MTLRIPSGTRDVLPEEMRALRRITSALLETFDRFGYGEISTPAVEFEETLRLADLGLKPSYRVVDDHGALLALRADMTVPIARVVATRYAEAEPPLRFCYAAHAYRAVRPHRGQMREFLQAGVELVGVPGPEGTAEVLTVLCRALEATGLREFSVGVGDATLYPTLLEAYGVPAAAREELLHELATRDLVAIDRVVGALGLDSEAAATLARIPRMRGGAGVLDAPPGPLRDALDGLRAVIDRLEPDIAARVIVDLGRFPRLGYYTGHDVRGLRPGARRAARRRRAVRRAHRPLRPPALGGRLRPRGRPAARRAGRRGAGGDEPVNRFGLTIAVPRGALLTETLDALEGIGIDTAEVRSNDRKLLFEDVGIVTMRPSDVATYVEAGAADIGITGKDVLMEQRERLVFELLDLGFGPCRMIVASPAGPDKAAEALRRLGVMRVATKYPRIAAEYFEQTGRQAEIVEVKGSVELAPLTGLAEAIVDLTATGTTLRENGLEIREEIATSTARLISNRVAHRVKAAAVDDIVEALRGG